MSGIRTVENEELIVMGSTNGRSVADADEPLKAVPDDLVAITPKQEWPVAGPDERVKVLLIYPNYRGMNMLPPGHWVALGLPASERPRGRAL